MVATGSVVFLVLVSCLFHYFCIRRKHTKVECLKPDKRKKAPIDKFEPEVIPKKEWAPNTVSRVKGGFQPFILPIRNKLFGQTRHIYPQSEDALWVHKFDLMRNQRFNIVGVDPITKKMIAVLDTNDRYYYF